MAYFACAKAALTGTDQSTRINIAKGLVSPYFTDFSGNKVLRGVLQADFVTGRSTGYATGTSLAERLQSAGRRITSDTGGTYVYADQRDQRRQPSQQSEPAQITYPAELHKTAPAIIMPAKTFAFPVKTVAIMGLAGIIGYLVLIK